MLSKLAVVFIYNLTCRILNPRLLRIISSEGSFKLILTTAAGSKECMLMIVFVNDTLRCSALLNKLA